MIKAQLIDEIASKISNAMPQNVVDLQADVEKNVRAVLQNTFSKFNLVTREEFEVQKRVLAQTRLKLEQLEKQIAALEQANERKA